MTLQETDHLLSLLESGSLPLSHQKKLLDQLYNRCYTFTPDTLRRYQLLSEIFRAKIQHLTTDFREKTATLYP